MPAQAPASASTSTSAHLDLKHYFSKDSVLQSEFAGWKFRKGQLELAQAIEQALIKQRILLAEAGTGTGKTLAYLLPALLSGKKILVSTHSKHLQDQLADRDVPALLRALNTTAQVAKLKGRQNYVCLQRLNDALRQGTFIERQEITFLKKIQKAVAQGLVSERGDMPALPEDSPVWQHATARPDQCLGSQCPEIKNCHTAKAKHSAMAADVVIINHHLLCADIAMRQQGIEALLPDCDVVVVDEAHQMAIAALGFFGQTWSSAAVLEWAKYSPPVIGAHSNYGGEARAAAHEIQVTLRALLNDAPTGRFAMDTLVSPVWLHPDDSKVLLDRMQDMAAAQIELTLILDTVKDHHPELLTLFKRGKDLIQIFQSCFEVAYHGLYPPKQVPISSQNAKDSKTINNTEHTEHTEPPTTTVFWYERLEHTLQLNTTALDAAAQVGQLATTVNKDGTLKPWIFVSATLAHGNTFTHAQTALGLATAKKCDTLIVPSPFDYAKQGRLFIPNINTFPAANTAQHPLAVAAHVALLAQTLGGRTAVLCTSRKAVAKISEELTYLLKQWAFTNHQPPIIVLSQLEHGRTAMLDYFRGNPRAVLVGAASLWEGLDLPGNLLNAVVIDKIPFAQPDNPVLAARLQVCKDAGGSPFEVVQLPEAGLSLKQGTGRLIRTERDWGVVSILDVRLYSTRYGKTLLGVLPDFAIVKEEIDLIHYCAENLRP